MDIAECSVEIVLFLYLLHYFFSIMSGDSPNAFTNENVFDFRDGRSSPGPTTSKEHEKSGIVTASVLVEPQRDKNKDKDADKEDDPDFSSPTLNPGADKDGKSHSNIDRTLEMKDSGRNDDSGRGDKDKDKEEQNLLNGGPDRLPKTSDRPKQYESDEDSEDESCIVNCIYYTMECCKCSIV